MECSKVNPCPAESNNEPPQDICYSSTLNAPSATKVVCFSRLLKCFRSLYDKQCGPRSDCSQSVLGPHCLLLYFNSSLMFGNYLEQTISADDIFRCIFLGALRVEKCETVTEWFTFLASDEFCHLITFANNLDSDQARQNVGPHLDPNC